MITGKSLFFSMALAALAVSVAGQSAFAQGFINKKTDLPDASHYYMSRLQVQYVDDSPIVQHQAGAGGQHSNSVPGVPPGGLPKAGFQQYTPDVPQMQSSLPKTVNGVPTKLPPPKPSRPAIASGGLKGKTGKLPANKPPTKPQTVEAYAPYKGYNPNSYGGETTASNGAASHSQSKVQGSVLHWARARHNTNGY